MWSSFIVLILQDKRFADFKKNISKINLQLLWRNWRAILKFNSKLLSAKWESENCRMQIDINDLQIFLCRVKVMKNLYVPCVQDASYPTRQKGQKCIPGPLFTYHLLSTHLQIWKSVDFMAFCTTFYRMQEDLINLTFKRSNPFFSVADRLPPNQS